LRHRDENGEVDWTATAAELRGLGYGKQPDQSPIPLTQPRHRATVPPDLAVDQRILDRFQVAVGRYGLVGESANAQLLYLSITSRLLERPVSVGVKGLSASGKSYTVEVTCHFFPAGAVIEMTAMSQRALVYSPDDYRHRVIVLYEVVALREAVEDDLTSYLMRSLLSEGRLHYEVTVRDPRGGWTTKKIEKEGPTGLIFTTTKARIHRENETRVLSLASDDSPRQTKRVLLALAQEAVPVDFAPWHQLQEWLEDCGERRVFIPYAATLAGLVPPVAVRLRRDFTAVLSLIKAHAFLHQASRARDMAGRVVANLEDYEVVRNLVAPLVAEGVGATVSAATRETVDAVRELGKGQGYPVMVNEVAKSLSLDKSNASRRLSVAAAGGWVTNLEDRRGRPGRWVTAEPLPEDDGVLPVASQLLEVAEGLASADDYEDAGQDL
jgi:hypothetical protein